MWIIALYVLWLLIKCEYLPKFSYFYDVIEEQCIINMLLVLLNQWRMPYCIFYETLIILYNFDIRAMINFCTICIKHSKICIWKCVIHHYLCVIWSYQNTEIFIFKWNALTQSVWKNPALGIPLSLWVQWCHYWPWICCLHEVTSAQIEEHGWQANTVFINISPTLHDCAVTLSIDYEILLCQLFNITNCLSVVSMRMCVHIWFVSMT